MCLHGRPEPAAEDVGTVGELDRPGGVLLDEQDRDAFGAQLLERVEDDVDHDRREPERRLVEEKQPRAREQCTGDRELLLLAAR